MSKSFPCRSALLVASMVFGVYPGAEATPFAFSYGGRLANSSDIAVTGPVNLEIKFYRVASGGNPVPVSPVTFANVSLEDGVFQVDLNQLSAAELALVFDASQDTYVEVTDRTNSVTYPRQHLSAMPYAMKVPVDGKTIKFGDDGNLTLAAASLPSANQFLTKDASGNLVWATPTASTAAASSIVGGTVASTGTLASNQVLLYNGSQWTPTAASALNFVSKAGDTMSGLLTLSANPTTAMQAATKNYVDTAVSTVAANISGSAPVTVTGSGTRTVAIARASGTTDGYLAAADYTVFSGAVASSGATPLTGNWAVGGYDLNGVGNLVLSANKTLALGAYPGDPGSLSSADRGKIWFNSGASQIKYYDGSSIQTVGAAGSGLTSLNGETALTQTFAFNSSGTVAGFTHASGVHTLSIPVATASTPGLLATADWSTFNAKVGSLGLGSSLAGNVSGGVANISISNSVGAGSYAKVTVNAQGLVTAGTTLASGDIPPHPVSLLTGTLPVGNGGTGTASLGLNGVLFGNGSSNILSTTAGTTDQVLIANGSGIPTFGAVNLAAAAAVTGTLPSSNIQPAGTNGTVQFNASGTLAGATNLVWNNSAGNLGIGSTAPASVVDIVTGGTLANLMFTAASTSATPSLLMRRARGSVASPTAVTMGDLLGRFDGRGYNGSTYSSSAASVNLLATENFTGSANGSEIAFFTTTNGLTGSTERMRIGNTGFVGIGTSTPQAPLHVVVSGGMGTPSANGLIASSLSPFRQVMVGYDGTSDAGYLMAVNNSNGSGRPMLINPYGGNIGIGTTNAASDLFFGGMAPRTIAVDRFMGNQGQSLTLLAGGGGTSMTNANGGNLILSSGVATGTGGSSIMLQTAAPNTSGTTDNNPAMRMIILGNGNVGIGLSNPAYTLQVMGTVAGNAAFANVSDGRLKRDVQDLSNSLTKIVGLRGVNFKWIDTDKYDDQRHLGFIAQELEMIVPEVIDNGSDGIKRVRYSDLIPLLVEGMKEQNADIVRLKAENARIKAASAQVKAFICTQFPDAEFCP